MKNVLRINLESRRDNSKTRFEGVEQWRLKIVLAERAVEGGDADVLWVSNEMLRSRSVTRRAYSNGTRVW